MAQTIVSSPFTDNRMSLAVTHTSHGFDSNDIGKAVRSSGTDGQFVVARANTAANAEVVGVITSIDSVNQYTITTSGFVDVVAAVPTATAGTVYFLAEAADSQLTSTEPTTAGAVSKPVAVITESDAKMLLIHYRGEVITSAVVANAPNDAQYVTLATSSGLSAERTLAGGTDITLVDAGANGAATLNHDDNFSGTAAQYTAATVTVNNTGHITAIAAGSAGPSQATQSAIEAETNQDTYVPPDLLKHSPGVAKAWVSITAAGANESPTYNVDATTDTGTGDRQINFTTDFSTNVYICISSLIVDGGAHDSFDTRAVGSVQHTTRATSESQSDRATTCAFYGDQ